MKIKLEKNFQKRTARKQESNANETGQMCISKMQNQLFGFLLCVWPFTRLEFQRDCQ